MKKLLLCLFVIPFLFGCSENKIEDKIDNSEDKIEYLKMEDVVGVWTLQGNDLCFLSLSSSGHYTLCFSNEIMGAGTFVLDNGFIIFNNGYLYTSDRLSIKKEISSLSINKENNELCLAGGITTYLLGRKNINLNFVKSNEKISPSVVGKVIPDDGMTGLNKYYNELEVEVIYMTEYVAKHEYSGRSKETGQRKVIKEYVWFYVYREPYTYTQLQNGNGEVLIYDFSSGVCSGMGLEMDLVKQ